MRTHLTVVPREDEMYDIMDGDQVVYTVSYERDSSCFWGTSATGAGDQSFDTLQQVTDYVAKNQEALGPIRAKRAETMAAWDQKFAAARTPAGVVEALLK